MHYNLAAHFCRTDFRFRSKHFWPPRIPLLVICTSGMKATTLAQPPNPCLPKPPGRLLRSDAIQLARRCNPTLTYHHLAASSRAQDLIGPSTLSCDLDLIGWSPSMGLTACGLRFCLDSAVDHPAAYCDWVMHTFNRLPSSQNGLSHERTVVVERAWQRALQLLESSEIQNCAQPAFNFLFLSATFFSLLPTENFVPASVPLSQYVVRRQPVRLQHVVEW